MLVILSIIELSILGIVALCCGLAVSIAVRVIEGPSCCPGGENLISDPAAQEVIDEIVVAEDQTEYDAAVAALTAYAAEPYVGDTHVIQQLVWRMWHTTNDSAAALALLLALYELQYPPYEINRALLPFVGTCDKGLRDVLDLVLSNVASQ